MSKISVIMPVYGVEQYIARAIESVIAQTYVDWELIVVNDGTQDRSREIASTYAVRDPRIRIVDKPNGGLSDARNAGLAQAAGEYINFMDSDDWIEPDFLETMVREVESRKLDLIVCGYYVDTVDGRGDLVSRTERIDLTGRPKTQTEYFDRMELYVNFAWNKLYRHDFLKRHKLLFEKGLWLVEDCEFMSRVLPCKPRFGFVAYPGYHYIQRPEQTLSKKFNGQVTGFIRRKMAMYRPILAGLGADDRMIRTIEKRVLASNAVYLVKQMMRSKGTRVELSNHIGSLCDDGVFKLDAIPLTDLAAVKDKLLLFLAKYRLVRVMDVMRKLM